MKCCEFCLAEFHPRPQVKNPRACENINCQKVRQRQNEKEWRSKNSEYPGEKYYEIKRVQRIRRIKSVLESLIKCFEVGGKLFGFKIIMEEFSRILEGLLFKLGVRQINKFWNFTSDRHSDDLAPVKNQNLVQTS